MDLTYKDKIIKYLGHNLNIETKNPEPNFHLDCKFSKKKVCSCVFRQEHCLQRDLSRLISFISSNDVLYDLKNNKIIYKNTNETKNYKLKVIEERIMNTPLPSLKEIVNDFEGDNFSSLELKEVYRLIEKDKKKCEFCTILIQDNNSFKGWKNDDGEYVLLCANCNKKFIDGTLDKDDENSTDFRKNGINSNNNQSVKNTSLMNSINSIMNGTDLKNNSQIFVSHTDNSTNKSFSNNNNKSANSNGVHNQYKIQKNDRNNNVSDDEEYVDTNPSNKNKVFKVTEVKQNIYNKEYNDLKNDKLVGNKRSDLFMIKKDDNYNNGNGV